MSTIVVLAFGTRGDVAPVAGLGVRLRAAGHRVAVAAQAPYAELVRDAGLEFRLLPKDTEAATRESATARELVDGGRMKPSKPALRELVDQLRGVGPAMAAAAQGADLLLAGGPVSTLFGYHIATALEIPSAALFLQPMVATGDFPPPPMGARSFGRWGNRTMWKLGTMGERAYQPLIAELRAELGLPAATLSQYLPEREANWPVLHGFSEAVVPRPAGWRDGVEITGYWWPPMPVAWQPPAELADFLAAGPAPVYVGLGSTATAKGAELSEIVAAALRTAGLRGVVQSGWAGLRCAGDDVITIGDVPHEWLFPRMAAVVHHAGAGTTAAALRAGVPSVPVTGIMDQPFWGRRLVRLGAAPTTMRRRDVAADRLAAALRTAVDEPGYRQRAVELAALLRAEDGAGRAVAAVERLLERQPSAC